MKHRSAFTMLELIFVMIVLGILAALAIPRIERDFRQEAADNILSAVRYTKHLALIDDKTDPRDPNWQKELWRITFTNGSNAASTFYTVSSDIDQDTVVDKDECAIDPANGKYMYNTTGATVGQDNDESPNIFIGNKYDIDTITFSGGCNGASHIAFDHLGRPYTGVGSATNLFSRIMTSDCNITFSSSNGTFDPFSIIIQRQTGYAYIDGQNGS